MDLNQLTPEQRQAVLMQAQQEANQRIMSDVSQVEYIRLAFVAMRLPPVLWKPC